MNNNETKLAAQMLSDYGDALGDKSCNDFEFPDSWSKEEVRVFVKDFHDWNGDPEEFDEDNPWLNDHCVADFLSHKLSGGLHNDN